MNDNLTVREIIENHLENSGVGFTIAQIVKEYLQENDFDGLFFPGVCSCELKDLFPCGDNCADCQAGYLQDNPTGEHDFIIGSEDPAKKRSPQNTQKDTKGEQLQ